MNQTVFLLLGSNLGNRNKVLSQARTLIGSRAGRVDKQSSIYETKAWGITEQPAFLNQVVRLKTRLNPHELLHTLLTIERELGRVRHQKWGERLIDIDILYYAKAVIITQKLKIPHPEIANRRFTLTPLAELAPQFEHPLLHKTHQELLNQCPDNLEVSLYTEL